MSRFLNESLDDWVVSLSLEERRVFIDALWEWIYSLECSDFDGIGESFAEHPWRTMDSIFTFIKDMDPE